MAVEPKAGGGKGTVVDDEPEPRPEDLFVPEASYFDLEKFKAYLDDSELPPHLRKGPDWSCCGKRCCFTFWGILLFAFVALVMWPIENGEIYSAIKAGHLRRFRDTINAHLRENNITDVDTVTMGQGRTGLHIAAQLDQPRIMEYLLKLGANPNAQKPSDGRAPLHVAAAYGRVDCVKVLLKGGADINARADYEWTPVLTSIFWSNIDITKVLLDAGADPQLEQGDGYNAVEMAMSYGTEDTVGLVLDAGGTVDTSKARYVEYTRWRARWQAVKKERGQKERSEAEDEPEELPRHEDF